MSILFYLGVTPSAQKDAGRRGRCHLLAASLCLQNCGWVPYLSGIFHIRKTKTVTTAGSSLCGNQIGQLYPKVLWTVQPWPRMDLEGIPPNFHKEEKRHQEVFT